jgi:peptidoglycan/LPS O-acetylase OafA/YrhL
MFQSRRNPSVILPTRSSAISIGERLDVHGGWTNGFDYLRFVLATAVIGWHSVFTSYGYSFEADIYASWVHPIIYPILPMFFALGGFLVTASLLRTKSFGEFLLLRMLRFFPALVVVVAITAVVVGPLMTVDPLGTYFESPKFFSYFLNAFGYFEEQLPGLFADNPAPRMVNVSLWTIPWEFGGSIALYGLILCRETARAKWLAAISVIAMIVVPILAFATHTEASLYSRPPGHLLLLAMLAGVCFYYFRYKIPFSFAWFVLSVALSVSLCVRAKSAYLAPVPIAYATIYLGLLSPPKFGFMKRADLSYGTYLYGCLVQQSLMFLFPVLRVWWANWIASACLSAMCAAGSWYFIEGPILRRKRQIIASILGAESSSGSIAAGMVARTSR